MKFGTYRINEDSKINLSKYPTDETDGVTDKEEAEGILARNIKKMSELQEKLYAQNEYSILLIFQAMDTAGKDSAIKHVMSGLNPQGTQVHSFKRPSDEELNHDYLWRANNHLPERGNIGIFNRSYYEEVLVVKVHNLVRSQNLPQSLIHKNIWDTRYRQIRDYEQYLTENGTQVIKFFLHISKDEQKKRLLARIDDKTKNWKFEAADIQERSYWDKYQSCYEEAIAATASENSPWYIIPSDKKWYARLVISEILVKTMEELDLKFPKVDKNKLAVLEECKQKLLKE